MLYLRLCKDFCAIAVLLVSLVNFALSADGDLDTSFDPGDIFTNAAQGYAVTVASDGRFYVSGEFIDVDNHATQGLVRFNPDGSVDTGFSVILTRDVSSGGYAPTAITIQSDNKILIGGGFTHVNGSPQRLLARLNQDGSLDSAFSPTVFGSSVHTIVIDSSQRILVGGALSDFALGSIGLVRLNNTDGNRDSAFNVQAINGFVAGVVENSDDTLIIGGAFTTVDGNARSRIAKLDANGVLMDFGPMGFNATANNLVESMAADSSGNIVFGGRFTEANGESRSKIARMNPTGVLDTGFDPMLIGNRVTDLSINSLGQIAVGLELVNTPFVVVDDDGAIDPSFGVGDIGRNVFGVAWQLDNLAFKPLMTVLGEFENPDNAKKGFLVARRNPTGEVDSTFIPGAFVQGGRLNTVVEDGLGRLLLGGTFKKFGVLNQPYLVRLRRDGRVDPTFQVTVDGSVTKIIVLDDGETMIGGFFANVNGVARSGLARLHRNGILDMGFAAAANGPVYEFLELHNGELLIGGQFSSVNNVARGSFARLDSSGNLVAGFPDLDFKITGSFNVPRVTAIKLDANDNILVAGGFTESNDFPRFRFARFDPNGLIDNTLTPEITGSGNSSVTVEEFLIQDGDNKLVFVGSFVNVNGGLQQYIARVNPNSGQVEAFDPVVGEFVNTVLQQPDGKLLFGTQIDGLIGGEHSGGVARTLIDGSLDQTFDAFPDGQEESDIAMVNDMVFTADGKLVIVGDFLNVGNQYRPAIAKLDTGLPPFEEFDDEHCVPIRQTGNKVSIICQ